MAGVLQFTLGLQASQFLTQIGVSSSAMVAFAGAGEIVKSSFESMFSAMERGAHLGELSARTGETVSHLYQLQEILKQTGLSADSAAPMILRVRKALSGVNEMGGKTNSIFAALGLDRAKLASESPLDAIQQITAALHKMNPNDAVGAANGLFGRFSAGDFMQMAGSAEQVAGALAHSKTEAALFASNAKAFREVGDLMTEIKSHIEGFWAGLASGLAPEIIKIEKYISSIDFTTMGLAVVQAFKDGSVTEIIVQGFTAAFEKVTNIIAGTLGNSGYWIGIVQVAIGEFGLLQATVAKMFLSLGDLLVAAFDTLFQKIYEGIGKIPKLGKLVGLDNYKAQSFTENYQHQKDANSDASGFLGAMFKASAAMTAEGIKNQAKALVDAYKNSGGPEQDKFAALVAGLVSRIPKAVAEETKSGPATGVGFAEPYKPEVTDLEKIGLIFNSSNGGGDVQQQVARNTADMLDMQKITNDHLATIAGKDFGDKLVND